MYVTRGSKSELGCAGFDFIPIEVLRCFYSRHRGCLSERVLEFGDGNATASGGCEGGDFEAIRCDWGFE